MVAELPEELEAVEGTEVLEADAPEAQNESAEHGHVLESYLAQAKKDLGPNAQVTTEAPIQVGGILTLAFIVNGERQTVVVNQSAFQGVETGNATDDEGAKVLQMAARTETGGFTQGQVTACLAAGLRSAGIENLNITDGNRAAIEAAERALDAQDFSVKLGSDTAVDEENPNSDELTE